MQETPQGSRLHIAIFGRRNAGKSSLINALTNQDIALVSDVPGTTTDPVYKAMEILPLGPVMIVDTAGIDDVGELGALRVERTLQVLHKTDLAVLVIDPAQGFGDYENELALAIKKRNIPVVGVVNKVDSCRTGDLDLDSWRKIFDGALALVSAKSGEGIEELKRLLIANAPENWEGPPIIGDLILPGDLAVLVVPIDTAAPKGRLILPQVQTIRDILDHGAHSIVVKENGLKAALANLRHLPKIVVTDSQEFGRVAAETPPEVLLTSFSILFARHKGDLDTLVNGARAVGKLKPGARILMAEGCTHHRQADDIGRVKIPRWLQQKVGGELMFEWVSGGGFPCDLGKYDLIVHCGACMLNRREMLHRLSVARGSGVPIINYGVLIACLHGILHRALAPFPAVRKLLATEEEGR